MRLTPPLRSSASAPAAPPKEKTLEEPQQDLERPWSVICHDDPISTMEFVVEVFRAVFKLSQARAYERMMRVHSCGSAVIGSWPETEARARVSRATARARANGFPLTFTLERD